MEKQALCTLWDSPAYQKTCMSKWCTLRLGKENLALCDGFKHLPRVVDMSCCAKIDLFWLYSNARVQIWIWNVKHTNMVLVVNIKTTLRLSAKRLIYRFILNCLHTFWLVDKFLFPVHFLRLASSVCKIVAVSECEPEGAQVQFTALYMRSIIKDFCDLQMALYQTTDPVWKRFVFQH